MPDFPDEDMLGNISGHIESILDEFTRRLEASVRRQVLNMFASSHLLKAVISHIFPSPPQGQGDATRLAILFSGGIDCAVIAYLAHKCVVLYHKCMVPPEKTLRFLPAGEPIDLLNVAFENPRSLKAKQTMFGGTINAYDVPDRLTGLEQLDELRSVCPHRRWNFVRLHCVFGALLSYFYPRLRWTLVSKCASSVDPGNSVPNTDQH